MLARGTIGRRDEILIMPKSLEAKTGLLFGAEGEEPFSTITNLCILLFIFHRVNLHSFNVVVRVVICQYIIYFSPNPCFIFGRV